LPFELLLLLNRALLGRDLRLLLLHGVNEHGAHLVVFDAFDLALLISKRQAWLNLGHFFRAQTEVGLAVLLRKSGRKLPLLISMPGT